MTLLTPPKSAILICRGNMYLEAHRVQKKIPLANAAEAWPLERGKQWTNKPFLSLEPLAPLGLQLPDNCLKMAIRCGSWYAIRNAPPLSLAPASSISREVSK